MDWPANAFSGLMQHEDMVFKSCFPASNTVNDEQLEQYQTWYLGMRKVMDYASDHVFILVTPPPMNPTASTSDAAARARAFSRWLQWEECLEGHSNISTFGLFGALSEDDAASTEANMLRQEYREGDDSHANTHADQQTEPLFASFVVQAVRSYEARLAERDATR